MNDINIKYLSAEQYAKTTGLGVEEVKRLCKTNQLEHFMTDGGHYKIRAYTNGGVINERYEKLLKENAELKAIIRNIKSLAIV